MSQNLAITNADNLVTLSFDGAFLSTATDIKVYFGDEVYTKLLNPTIVIVDSDTQLSLNLSDTLEVGKIFVTIKRFDALSVKGSDRTSRELGNLGQIIVAIGAQLIVEDGSQVANSNSFVSDAEYKAYANLRGLTVAATQPDREAHLIAAMDYLKSIEGNVQGRRVSSTQSLMFPRLDVWLYGYTVNSDVIPQEIKNAQMEAAAFSTSNEILTNSTNDNVKSQQLDVMRVEYFSGGSMNKVNMQRVNAQLSALLQPSDKLVRT